MAKPDQSWWARWVSRFGSRPPPDPETAPPRFEGQASDLPVQNFPRLERLQSLGPVHLDAAWNSALVVGYEAVAQVLARPQLYSSSPQLPIDEVLLGADPPNHAPVRRMLAAYFSKDSLAALLTGWEDLAASLIVDEFDTVAGFAEPLTSFVGSRMLEVDPAAFRRISRAVQAQHKGLPLPEPIDLDSELRRTGLHARLLRESGGLLDDDSAASLVSLLSTASFETTERLIARAVLVLLRREDLRTELSRAPDLMPLFVEEVLRLFPPEPTLLREAVQTTRIGDSEIAAGTRIRLSVAAANRDPAQFDDPHSVRLDRPKKQHFSFGGGVHQCIGAGLARRTAGDALRILLREAPALEPAEPLDAIAFDNVGRRLLPRRILVRTRPPP